jgi:hypothetical protein
MEPITNVVQLRRYLAEQFPNLRLCSEKSLVRTAQCWPTGLAQMDRLLGGGLPKSAITELVSPESSSGSALVLFLLLRRAHLCRHWVALVDAHDSFAPSALGEQVFPRFLWVRCRDAAQALKATDLLLRDGNLSLVLLDLRLSSATECRKIPATTWHRFQRLVKPVSTALLVNTPRPVVSSPHLRLQLKSRLGLSALDRPESELLAQLQFQLTHDGAGSIEEELLAKAG